MEAVRFLEWLHFLYIGLSMFGLDSIRASISMTAAESQLSSFSQKNQISSSAVNSHNCSQQWAPYYVMVNLIIEDPCPVFHIYRQNDSLFILTAGSEFVSHSNRVLIIYRQQHICLKPNHCLSVNLSEPDANEPSFWLTAPHKLITAHTLHYSTIRLSIIL